MSNKITEIITSERFGKGFTYDAYLNQMGANKERFLESEAAFKLSPEDTRSFQNIAKKLGPLKVLALAEDWSPDVHRALPVLDKIVKAGGMELRIFSRDQNLDIMDLFLNRGEFRSIPTFVFFNANQKYLCHWIERPAVAVKFLEDVDKELAPKNLSLEDRRKERRMRSLPQWNLWRQETAREIKELLSKVSQ